MELKLLINGEAKLEHFRDLLDQPVIAVVLDRTWPQELPHRVGDQRVTGDVCWQIIREVFSAELGLDPVPHAEMLITQVLLAVPLEAPLNLSKGHPLAEVGEHFRLSLLVAQVQSSQLLAATH